MLVRTMEPSHALPLQGSFDEVPGITEELYNQLTELRAWMAYCYADRRAQPPARQLPEKTSRDCCADRAELFLCQ